MSPNNLNCKIDKHCRFSIALNKSPSAVALGSYLFTFGVSLFQ